MKEYWQNSDNLFNPENKDDLFSGENEIDPSIKLTDDQLTQVKELLGIGDPTEEEEPQGPEGPEGPKPPQGPKGPEGPKPPEGPEGPEGPEPPEGPQGPPGGGGGKGKGEGPGGGKGKDKGEDEGEGEGEGEGEDGKLRRNEKPLDGRLVPGYFDPNEDSGMDENDLVQISDEEKESIWVDPKKAAKELGRLIEEGKFLEQEKKSSRQRGGKKSFGGEGRGKGGRSKLLDDILIYNELSNDIGEKMKSFLNVPSTKLGPQIPVKRRLKAGRLRSAGNIPGRKKLTNAIKEVNFLFDTSGSMDGRALAVAVQLLGNALTKYQINRLNVYLWHNTPYATESFKNFNIQSVKKVQDWIGKNIRSGGNDLHLLYNKILADGKGRIPTIHITDGYITGHENARSSYTDEVGRGWYGVLPKKEWTKVIDPEKMLWILTIAGKRDLDEKQRQVDNMKKVFPGEIVSAFVDDLIAQF